MEKNLNKSKCWKIANTAGYREKNASPFNEYIHQKDIHAQINPVKYS